LRKSARPALANAKEIVAPDYGERVSSSRLSLSRTKLGQTLRSIVPTAQQRHQNHRPPAVFLGHQTRALPTRPFVKHCRRSVDLVVPRIASGGVGLCGRGLSTREGRRIAAMSAMSAWCGRIGFLVGTETISAARKLTFEGGRSLRTAAHRRRLTIPRRSCLGGSSPRVPPRPLRAPIHDQHLALTTHGSARNLRSTIPNHTHPVTL
jgi:hypothetical protein